MGNVFGEDPGTQLIRVKMNINMEIKRIDRLMMELDVRIVDAQQQWNAKMSEFRVKHATYTEEHLRAELTPLATEMADARERKKVLFTQQTNLRSMLKTAEAAKNTADLMSLSKKTQKALHSFNKTLDMKSLRKLAVGYSKESALMEQKAEAMHDMLDDGAGESRVEDEVNETVTSALKQLASELALDMPEPPQPTRSKVAMSDTNSGATIHADGDSKRSPGPMGSNSTGGGIVVPTVGRPLLVPATALSPSDREMQVRLEALSRA